MKSQKETENLKNLLIVKELNQEFGIILIFY